MARPLRIEFEGALYHVMTRGNGPAEIFLGEEDRHAFVDNLARVCQRFDWRVWAWCQMTNHYHLLVETRRPTLSKGMREVIGVYTQSFNRYTLTEIARHFGIHLSTASRVARSVLDA